ncbi:MAG: hypothetical protein ACFFBD_30035, partial [Candidatus Hodarchaeota archaeon]
MKTGTYHGISIIQRDGKVLRDLEKIVGKPLPSVPEIKYETFGYKIEEERVIGLALTSKSLTFLPECIGDLLDLQTLYVRDNQLTS